MTPNDVLKIRKDRDLTQQDLAEIIGVTVQTIHRYERGKSRILGAARKSLERLQKETKP